MYSRRLGISDENSSGNLESFNERLREQYAQKRKLPTPVIQKTEKEPSDEIKTEKPQSSLGSLIEKAEEGLTNLKLGLDFESILILGIILLIIADTDTPDLILLGILISLIF